MKYCVKDRDQMRIPFFFLSKLQLTYLWFGRNLSCLPMIWQITNYTPNVSSVTVLYNPHLLKT